jgi:hypothetical protein
MNKQIASPLVGLAGWLVPGLGYVLIGQRMRGVIIGSTIVFTFIFGLLLGGVRVVDVPGYTNSGERKQLNTASGEIWALTSKPLAEVLGKPWYIAQTLVGPMNMAATYGSIYVAKQLQQPASTARIYDIGTLYTAVAGMLNLLAIIDAVHRSSKPRAIKSASQSGPVTSESKAGGM